MFVDEIKIYAKAGDGGDGVVRWLHLRGKEFSGPAGGNGGNGGDVYVRAVRDLNVLSQYQQKPAFYAEDGEDGMKNSKFGKNGEDKIIALPLGSIVTNLSNNKKVQLLSEGEQALVLKGGKGGLGNESFKSSRNTTPQEFTKGTDGEQANFFVELEIMADAGLIGFPNVGKSTLLNELTHSRAKVKNYPFTTLDPNLGDFYGYILADIPGLLEGAAQGKGLGYKFLRHIKRTKFLIHCISLEAENSPKEMLGKYETIRKELGQYDQALHEKPEIIVLTKTDVVDEKKVEENVKAFQKINSDVLAISAYADNTIKAFSDFLAQKLENL